MELEIDYAIKGKYGDYHDSYARHLKIFKSFIRVFEVFFKKEKYQNSEIKIDEDEQDKAAIKFCSKKYQLNLVMDPAGLRPAAILLAGIKKDRTFKIAAAIIDKSENIIFPDKKSISLKDDYEFNNAVLNFFISGITEQADSDKPSR